MPVVKLRGLPWSCTPDDITKFLNGVNILLKPSFDSFQDEPSNNEGFGDQNLQTMKPAIYLTTNSEGRPSGEAFVELNDENDLDSALKRNNALMGQRYIEGDLNPSSKLSKPFFS